jgi:hypothetical protein
LGASAYYLETFEKICSVVNELDGDRNDSGFSPVLSHGKRGLRLEPAKEKEER